MDVSYITAADLQDEIIGPIFIDGYREQVSRGMRIDEYMKFLAGFTRSLFQDFESYLRTKVELVENDINLALDKSNSSFVTYEIQPFLYTLKDLCGVLFNILQPEFPRFSNVFDIDFHDIRMKSKMVVRRGIIAMRFDEKSFFSTILGFKPHWDCNH